MNSLEVLKQIAKKIAELDDKIVEVFIHSDTPHDPLEADEIYLVCHLLDHGITHDLEIFNDKGTSWSIEIREKVLPLIEKLHLNSEIIIVPFNYKLYAQNEYGKYFITVYLKRDFCPILETADLVVKENF